MSKPTKTEVVSNTTFNTVIDSKVTRQELVNMILEEQEAQLEDALEKAQDVINEASKVRNELNKVFREAIIKEIKDPNIVKNLQKIFKDHDIKVTENVSINYGYVFENIKNQNEKNSNFEAKIKVIIRNKIYNGYGGGSGGYSITHSLITTEEILKLKGMKLLAKKYTDSCDAYDKALEDYKKVTTTQATFEKKGKRSRAAFVREMMKNTDEGKQILAQLDAIKQNTQKLLE